MNSFFLSSLFHSSTKLAACLIYALSPFFLLCLPYLSLSICRFTISFFNHPLSHFSLLLVLFPNFTSCVFYSFSFLNFYYLLSLSFHCFFLILSLFSFLSCLHSYFSLSLYSYLSLFSLFPSFSSFLPLLPLFLFLTIPISLSF